STRSGPRTPVRPRRSRTWSRCRPGSRPRAALRRASMPAAQHGTDAAPPRLPTAAAPRRPSAATAGVPRCRHASPRASFPAPVAAAAQGPFARAQALADAAFHPLLDALALLARVDQDEGVVQPPGRRARLVGQAVALQPQHLE